MALTLEFGARESPPPLTPPLVWTNTITVIRICLTIINAVINYAPLYRYIIEVFVLLDDLNVVGDNNVFTVSLVVCVLIDTCLFRSITLS